MGLGHVSQLLYAGLERGLAIGGLHVAEDGHRADGQTRYDTQNAHHQAEGDGIGLFPLTGFGGVPTLTHFIGDKVQRPD